MDKIQVWGDSILKGIIYDDKSNKYVILKNNALQKTQESTKIVIENFSRFGQTILRAKPKLLCHLNDKELPDTILLEMGGNDCDFNWKEVGDAPEQDHQPNTPIDQYRQTMIELLTMIRQRGIEPILATMPPLEHQRYFDWITRGDVNRNGVLQWLGSTERIYTWHEGYDIVLRQIAETMSVSILDLRSAFLTQIDYASLLCSDGIHPNQKGQQLIGQTIVAYLKERLKQPRTELGVLQ